LWFRICGNYRQSLRVSPSGALRFLILTPIKKLLAAIPAQYCHQGPHNKVLSDRGCIGRQPKRAVPYMRRGRGTNAKPSAPHHRRLCCVSILLSREAVASWRCQIASPGQCGHRTWNTTAKSVRHKWILKLYHLSYKQRVTATETKRHHRCHI